MFVIGTASRVGWTKHAWSEFGHAIVAAKGVHVRSFSLLSRLVKQATAAG
jgi:hypothetical protein